MIIEEDTWTKEVFHISEFIWDANDKTLTYKKVVKHGALPSNFEIQGEKYLVQFGEIEDDMPGKRCVYPVRAVVGHRQLLDTLRDIQAIMHWKKV